MIDLFGPRSMFTTGAAAVAVVIGLWVAGRLVSRTRSATMAVKSNRDRRAA